MRHPHLLRSALMLAAFAVTGAGATAQSPQLDGRTPSNGTGAGRLVIVGGGLSRANEDVYSAVIAGRDGAGPICVIPTAGAGDPQRTIAGMVEAFDAWNGIASGIVISTANPQAASDPAIVEQIRECSGFYFTGGVQSRIVTVFRPHGENTPAYDALMSRFAEGAVVAGSSAGAAIMSDPMIAGGSTSESLANGIHRAPAESDEDEDASPTPGTVAITPGMGFFRDAIVDQHFLARGRIGRLVTAVLDLDEYDLGFGIDENTALVVDGDTARAAGASGVIVIDAREATRNGRSAGNVKLHLLGAGDAYDIESRRVLPVGGRSALTAAADSAIAPEIADDTADDIFARWAFLHTLHRFARSSRTELVLPFDGGEMVLRKGADFAARAAEGVGVEGTPAGLSITGLLLDIRR